MGHRRDFADRLLAWFDGHRRDLPWRRTTDPWAIWVSEVMLQQTRVEAVREPFVRFLGRFPTPAAFAAASDDELLTAWRGLGYYRRARLLRDGAREVVARHRGKVPADLQALGELPGIGAYTKGAVGSIGFGHPEPAIDGNVERVLARHQALRDPIKSAAVQRTLRERAAAAMPADRPGDFNQALMELGALVCTPTSPACASCPIAADCQARRLDLTAVLPNRPARPVPVEVMARVILVHTRAGALGSRVPSGEPNAGQVELPGGGALVSVPAEDLAAALRQRFGARITPGPVLTTVRHSITNHRITVHAHAATVHTAGDLTPFPLSPDTPWTTASRKVFLRTLGGDGALQA